ncbi:MAG: protein translocase subunit SecD [Pseudanabaenaceae cyanobacterium]
MPKPNQTLTVVFALVLAAVVTIVALPPRLGLDLRGGAQLTLQALPNPERGIPEITPRILESARFVVEKRINGLGVAESTVQTSGRDRILVQMPGVNDPAEAERVLGNTAQLEFRVQRPGTEGEFLARRRALANLLSERESLSPTDREAIARKEQEIAEARKSILGLFDSVGLTGERLRDALPTSRGQGDTWDVSLRFDGLGGELFAKITAELGGTGRSIGIFLDDELVSAPVVPVEFQGRGITGGEARIEIGTTLQAASDLALQVRSGALPVPVTVLENRTVGASLGADSIRRSIWAGLGGLVLVLVYMVVYYRLPGAIADLALLIYAVLTIAAFSLLGVVLSLPGIAGFILSVGMAVDANVLIFARIREELLAGRTLYKAVEAGFNRAWSSILDSNATTLIACGALFWLGAGLVKGFAVTLAIGVVISMFTAITGTRSLLLLAIANPALRRPQWYGVTAFRTASEAEPAANATGPLDLVKHGRGFILASSAVVAAGLVVLGLSWVQTGLPVRPALDFVGGTRLGFELVCAQPENCGPAIDITAVRQAMAAKGYGTATLQLAGEDKRALVVQTASLGVEERQALQSALQEALRPFGELDPAKQQIEEVGPVIGRQLLVSGLTALAVALGGIALYLRIRFQMDYAVFAIVALLHDVWITVSVFSLLGLVANVSVDSLFIVAILTICGFSVNDTVVIYDRVRENAKTVGDTLSFGEVVNRSVNQSLSRSINTSLTTILPLVSILVFGGATLQFFALALIVGFLAGVYSSIFNASILLLWWRERGQTVAPPTPVA